MPFEMSKLITNPLTSSQIESLLRKNEFFSGVYACDSIPDIKTRPCAIIVNTDPADEPGEHWVAMIFKQGGRGFFFDSFGFPPLIPKIQDYMIRHAYNGFKYNSTTLQHPDSNTCGYYCIAFIHLWSRGWTLRMFCSYFSGRNGQELIRNDNRLLMLFSV